MHAASKQSHQRFSLRSSLLPCGTELVNFKFEAARKEIDVLSFRLVGYTDDALHFFCGKMKNVGKGLEIPLLEKFKCCRRFRTSSYWNLW